MSSNTLDALGRAVLEAIEGRRVTTGMLVSELDTDRAEIDDRLAQLVDNGLIREGGGDDDEMEIGGATDGYTLTENGLRLLDSTPVGARDNRIDTPAAVDRAIEGFDLRPDEAAAVRNAVSFLRYWGEATAAEIVDATYSEAPAGYETADRWWDDCVRERLAALPDVRVDADDSVAGFDRWTYDGIAVVERRDRDGRSIEDPMDEPLVASARHAVETAGLDEDERVFARAALAALAERARASTDELLTAVDMDWGARHDPVDVPSDQLAAVLESVPGVDRESGSDGVRVWVYDPAGRPQ